MDEQVQELADRLVWQVTDADAGQGRYQWADDNDPIDPEVVGFLVNHYRTAGTALAELTDRLQATELALAATMAPPEADVVVVHSADVADLGDVLGPVDG